MGNKWIRADHLRAGYIIQARARIGPRDTYITGVWEVESTYSRFGGVRIHVHVRNARRSGVVVFEASDRVPHFGRKKDKTS